MQSKQIPRIQSISKVDGFCVYCVFNMDELRVVNFEKLFEKWDLKPGDAECLLLDLKEFKKVTLRDGVLSWENVSVSLIREDGTEENFPYEIDPVTLYAYSEVIFANKWRPTDKVVMMVRITSSRIETVKSGQLYPVFDDKKDDERYIIDDDGEMVLFDQNIFKWEILPTHQERLLRLKEEALAGKNLISDEEAWKRLERWKP